MCYNAGGLTWDTFLGLEDGVDSSSVCGTVADMSASCGQSLAGSSHCRSEVVSGEVVGDCAGGRSAPHADWPVLRLFALSMCKTDWARERPNAEGT